MILYYAPGGGLGHLTRARAVIHTLGVDGPWSVITASRFAADPRVSGPMRVVPIPAELAGDQAAYRRWLRDTMERLAPEAIYIDAFPGGILGEFAGFSFPEGVPRHHIARLLRWENYRGVLRGALPGFDRSYLVEPLAAAQDQAIAAVSGEMLPIALTDPPDPFVGPPLPSMPGEGPLWLVVHAEPAGEIGELIAYATDMAAAEGVDPRIVVVAPSRPALLPDAVAYADRYPASALFSSADRIITGCGFNAMRQTLPHWRKHRFLPFHRRYDDQFLRAARRREMIREQIGGIAVTR